jgi:formiminoglutamate deiminase
LNELAPSVLLASILLEQHSAEVLRRERPSTVSATFHCELAWLGGATATANVLIAVEGERIISVEAGVPFPPNAVGLPGLTLPGLANAHSHAFHRALRSRTQSGTGSFWTWREQMYAVAAKLNPDSYFALARAVFGEMVRAGFTTVGEFHYLHHGPGGVPYADANAMGHALTAAATEAGIRITLLDTCYLSGGFGAPLNETQRRFCDGDVDTWAQRVGALSSSAGSRIGAAIHSVRAVDPPSIETVAAWAATNNAPLHAHVSEQPAENEQCLATYRKTPMQVLADHGALSDRFSAVHATHPSSSDIALLAQHRCSVCMCPTTERDLADGIGPTRAFRDAGVAISLGSDSHAVIDVFEEARAVEMGERLQSGERGTHDVVSLLTMATASGHASLGWPDAGRIAVGAIADLVTVDLGSVRSAGVDALSALSAVVFACTAADVRHVVVGGQVVVRDHAHIGFDVSRSLHQTITELWE